MDDLSDEFLENFGTQKRKRTHDDAAYIGYDEYDEDSGDDEEPSDHHGARRRHGPIDHYLETSNSRRSTRANTRASSLLVSSEGEHDQATRGRRLRPRVSTHLSHDAHYDDRDELQDSDGDADDPTFGFVQSDIVPTKQRKRLRKFSMGARAPVRGASRGDDSDIEFEPRHRSSWANKNTRVVNDAYVDDDDIYYDDGDRPAAAPRILSMREIFQESSSPEFNEAHRPVCESCGSGDNKGPLVPCQGCSNSYHKLCLGIRSSRDHVVTKVGPDSFVMQCRFCIGISKKKDTRAPTLDVCQGCHTKNPSCAPFSQKQTPKQEEQLRLENDGVDPITPVDPTIIDNPDNVLFRCGRCHRAWHYEHLPHPTRSRDPALDDPLRLRKHRREEYQITWLCKACQDTDEDKVDKIVAWRPVDPKSYTKGQSMLEFDEDSLEYLLKWEKKSYNHCLWLPGAWVHGAVNAIMRLAFIRRTLGEGADDGLDGERNIDSLLRWTEMEAIHDSWITPDIILDVHYAPRSGGDAMKYMAKSARDKFEDDLNRIYHVIKIFVKFEGLGYDDAVWDTPPPPDSGAIYDAYIEAYHEYLNGKHFQSDPWSNMEKRIDQFRQLDFETAIEVKEQPKGLTRGKLMEYQIDGLNWMLYNFRFGRSVILADEMGLGKTVQVVAFLASFIHDSPRIWPFLIVVPNATCPNWRREIKKWAPDLRVVAYYGGRRPQSLALEYELFPNGSRAMRAHVVIMSYDSAKDPETRSKFNRVKWAGLIVDEAQALKNDENTLYKALEALRIPFKLLLTGTPLQNNKRELFNLLQFIDPTRKAEELDEQFAQISSENLANLHEIIRPYFLRRTKAMVLTFLPPMAQIIVPVSMTVLQERLCKSIMERNPQLIRSVFVQSKMKASDRSSLSNILIQLRKCLCHPFIYSQAIEDRTTSPELMRRNLVEASSKLMLLEIMLPKLKERGHRVLLFSQFLDQLTILEDFLTSLNLKYERLDGGQSSLEKQRKIDAFNAPDSDLFAMLLSTRAGGVGINLATADTVIILDPDWNPHQDIQALSRAHRIGQRKKVLCFQLVTVDSAEEKILQIGRKKLALDHLLIETMDTQEDAPKDVESVLKHGAAALFGEGKKKEAITYDSAAVDKLLDRSIMEETKTDDDKSAESAFAHARVWANDEGALADDLQGSGQNINLSVWDQILQQRAEEARREAERNMQLLGRGGRRRGAQTTNYTGPRFEFDDGHNEAGAESEHGDGDGDFVGSDKSDGESSEEESAPATGESTPTGSGLRKTQGKGAKEDSKADPEAAAPKKTRGGSRDAKAQAKKANDAKASTTIAVLRPSAAQSDSEEGTQHAHKKGPGRPRKDTGSSNRQPATPGAAGAGSAGHADGRQPNSRGQPSTGSGLGQPQQGGGGGGSSRTGQPNVSVASVVPPGGFRFIVSRQPALSAVLANPVPANPVPDKIPARPCFVCHYCHPMTWECPEMSSEVSLRMALDRLMSLPVPQHPGLFNQMHFFLTDKLRRLKAQNGQG